MNAEIFYYGVPEPVRCSEVKRTLHERWDQLDIGSAVVPHMLHLLRIQGLPIASMFSGELRYGDECIHLADWMLAKCASPHLWEVPYVLRGVVLVKGDTRESTELACVGVHSK